MPFVRFNSVDDFLGELRQDADLVERDVVRVTFSTRYAPPMYVLTLVATAVVAGTLVALERRCGEYMFPDSDDAKRVSERGEEYATKIREAAAELGLEVRDGVFRN